MKRSRNKESEVLALGSPLLNEVILGKSCLFRILDAHLKTELGDNKALSKAVIFTALLL